MMSDPVPMPLVIENSPETRFQQEQRQLTRFLLQQILLKSYWICKKEHQPYPFIHADTVLPSQDGSDGLEKSVFKTAFLVCVDGTVPTALNKHFRLRASNRVTWRNIRRFGPKLDLSGYKTAHCRLDSDHFEDLLQRLLPMDYALLIERPIPDADGRQEWHPLTLTHMHVKVERLTDNAIKDLGKSLGYIERRLFERGEDYVEALEGKYFEYYGFSERASGRKSAAAMAAQLLAAGDVARQPKRFAVYVASQEDGRLTILDDTDRLTQYMLVQLTLAPDDPILAPHYPQLRQHLEDYCLDRLPNGDGVFLLRMQLGRTSAAQPGNKRRHSDELLAPWLVVNQEELQPLPGHDLPAIPIRWAHR